MNEISRRALKRQAMRLERVSDIRRAFERTHCFPPIRIESTMANPPFRKMVSEVLNSFDISEPELLPTALREFLKSVRRNGYESAAIDLLKTYPPIARSESQRLSVLVLPALSLGKILMERLLKVDSSIFPANDFEVHFRGNEIVIALSSMLERSTSGGRVFHSRKRLNLENDGRDYVVAFSQHAIDSICKRFKPDYKTYGGLGDAHALFSYLSYVEQVKLKNGDPALAVFE